MNKVAKSLNRFCRQESGATSVEYAVIIGMLTLVVFAGIQSVGGETLATWFSNSEQIGDAMNN